MPNRCVTAALVCLLAAGCSEQSIQARGFAMPPGDAESGKITFIEMQCQQCHRVDGVVLPVDGQRDEPALLTLGGNVPNIKTQGDLVTSIINPSHKIVGWREKTMTEDGQSKMTDYNDVMTVQQLIDLVAFLQERYDFTPPVYPLP